MCTVGVDLGVVPEAADLLTVTGADTVAVIAPARDHLPYLSGLTATLAVPTSIVEIDVPWR